MAKVHIPTDGHGNALDQPKAKSKAKPKKYVMMESISQYLLERDRILWKIGDEETKEQLRIKYGKDKIKN